MNAFLYESIINTIKIEKHHKHFNVIFKLLNYSLDQGVYFICAVHILVLIVIYIWCF